MIGVYALKVSEIDVSDERLLKQMSPRRLEKINALRPISSKKQSLGAELILNYALRRTTGVKTPVIWETDENGKLFVPRSDVYVNLSHSGDYAVCAVCSSSVGVDIQKMKTPDFALAKRFFTDEEYKYVISASEPSEAFFDVWTRKESFIKAVGKGLKIPLSSFSALGDTIDYDGRAYRFKRYAVKDAGYKLCVCFAV